MKKWKLWGLLLCMAVFLCACGKRDPLKDPILSEEDSLSGNINGENPSDSPLTIVTEDDSTPPREGMVRSKLTNEWVDEEIASTRPIAVIIPNEADAIPHYSLSSADILYEANVEGRMTRLMAVYENWQGLEKIGNIRSLRDYFAYWAFEWDAVLVHYGGPFFIDELLMRPTTQTINGNGSDEAAFFRDEERIAPHNAYITGESILNTIKAKNYSLSYRGLTDDRHFRFATKAEPNTLQQYGDDAKNATYIDMSGCYPLTRCYFEYREEDGLYYRSQHLSGSEDIPHTDALNGKQLAFKNILVQYTKYEELGEGYLAFQCHDTTEDGWYFTNGKGIHVTWEKTSDYGATRYYDDNGNEICLNTGKTMICIVEDGDSFSYH